MNSEPTTYRCPTTPTPYDDDPDEYMAGCGHEFDSWPDREGYVDCPNCGMWFSPAKEPDVLLHLAANLI